MNIQGRATDYAITERFYRNLKQECLYLYDYESVSVAEVKTLIDNYIDFYNSQRLHQSLDYLTLDEIYVSEEVG